MISISHLFNEMSQDDFEQAGRTVGITAKAALVNAIGGAVGHGAVTYFAHTRPKTKQDYANMSSVTTSAAKIGGVIGGIAGAIQGYTIAKQINRTRQNNYE